MAMDIVLAKNVHLILENFYHSGPCHKVKVVIHMSYSAPKMDIWAAALVLTAGKQ
jgi:hypothetical protein